MAPPAANPDPEAVAPHRRAAIERWLHGVWWPSLQGGRDAAALLQRWLVWPSLVVLSWLYGGLRVLHALPWDLRWRKPVALPVPVIVVGNVVVGGAGKTPTVIALVQALRERGWTPGVVSRGHGRRGDSPAAVTHASDVGEVGDEPLLIHHRTQAPVWVGRRRDQAALALCRANPQVDVLISDDGLQHRALHRDLELIVFGERGLGNGRQLPAGPLREPLGQRFARPLASDTSLWAHRPPADPSSPSNPSSPSSPGPSSEPDAIEPTEPAEPALGARVLYSAGVRSTTVPGFVCERRTERLVALRDWHVGLRNRFESLASWTGRQVHAAAGIADPQAFFRMLSAQGLRVVEHPMADHAEPSPRPWPAGATPVIVTEKDAVKIAPESADAKDIWVATLDLALPENLLDDISRALKTL